MKPSLFTVLTLFLLLSLSSQAQHYRVQHLGTGVNTTGSESAAILVDDSVVLFNSFKSSSNTTNRLYLVDFAPTVSQVAQARYNPDGSVDDVTPNNWGLNKKGYNCGNVAYDSQHGVIYFTQHDNGANETPHIYYARRTGNRWSKPLPVGGNVNLKGYTSTHPAVGYLPDGKTILYFSSDRPGGMGALDIWYAVMIRDGMPGNCINLGFPVNSDSNEVTPFYSNDEDCLYFSSDRTGGEGGYDVYRATGARNSWQSPTNLGKEINSKHNDIFFNVFPCRCNCPADSGEAIEACGFLTSNRQGSLYESDSNCCNDLYRWSRYKSTTPPPAPVITTTAQPETTLQDFLPLSLYFHNDEPNPNSKDTVTTLSYSSVWKQYNQMRDEYKSAQACLSNHRRWDSIRWAVDHFFDDQVAAGYWNLNKFLDQAYHLLSAGRHITITLDGYASPLHESEYNINLSKRRIDCIRNCIREWNGKALVPFLNNGRLTIQTAAHGAASTDVVAPTDPRRDPKDAKSVYSIEAALDRRVDIIAVTIE